MKTLRAFIKPFKAPQRSVKIKNKINVFSSSGIRMRRINPCQKSLQLFSFFRRLDISVQCLALLQHFLCGNSTTEKKLYLQKAKLFYQNKTNWDQLNHLFNVIQALLLHQQYLPVNSYPAILVLHHLPTEKILHHMQHQIIYQ